MQIAGKYQLGPLVGRGGLADVHVATDPDSGQTVAIKRLRRADSGAGQRLAREAEVLRTLDHPAIPHFYEFHADDQHPYLVLELVDGKSLAEILREGPLPIDRIRTIGARVADALAHAHEHGVIHRDVKPANMLVSAGDAVHLIDFGVARDGDPTATITGTGLVVGTVAYLSPEQVRGEPIGPATDIYALGLVLVECVTGERAYAGSSLDAALARLNQPPVLPDDVPAWFRALVERMTALDPANRPAAAEVVEYLDGESAPDDAPTVITDVGPATTVMPIPAGAAAAAAAAGVAAGAAGAAGLVDGASAGGAVASEVRGHRAADPMAQVFVPAPDDLDPVVGVGDDTPGRPTPVPAAVRGRPHRSAWLPGWLAASPMMLLAIAMVVLVAIGALIAAAGNDGGPGPVPVTTPSSEADTTVTSLDPGPIPVPVEEDEEDDERDEGDGNGRGKGRGKKDD